MFDNILIYVDKTLPHDSLVQCAINVAKANNAKVALMGTLAPLDNRLELGIAKDTLGDIYNEQKSSIQIALDKVKAQLKQAGIEAGTQIVKGKAFIEISKQVLRDGHDLVMLLADDQQSGFSKAFFGSTQMQLLRYCPCAVWVVKEDSKAIARHILAPIDVEFSDLEEADINNSIVNVTHGMAKTGCQAIDFMHVWSIYGEGYLAARTALSQQEIKQLRKQRKGELKQKLQELVHQTDWQGCAVKLALPRNKLASAEIVKAVKKRKIDLLVMGTLCRTGIEGFVIGNTAEKILSEVSCAVLALKPPGFVSPITL